MKRTLLLLIFVFSVSGILTANGMLVGDGKKQSDMILVGKVVSFEENKTALETNYVVEVEEYLKTPKHYDTNTKTINIASPGLRHYNDTQKEMIYNKIFNVGDRILFLLYLKDEKLRESLWSLTTKSSCTPQQLLDEMYGPSGLSISQNNQARHLYTNQPVDLTFHVYNRDLISEKKDFEFKVFTPVGKLSERKQVELQECKRSAEVKWSFVPTIAGKYTFSAIIGNSEGGSESYSGVLIKDYVDSPLKQHRAETRDGSIKCQYGLELLRKTSNGSSACVKPETKEKLIERGWGMIHLDKIIKVQGTKHSVKYRIDGNATITDITYNEDTASVMIKTASTTTSNITIELPRTLIDSGHSFCDKYGEDEDFIVLVDNEEVHFKETATTPQKRTLSIPFQENTVEIEIIAICLI